MSTIKQLEDFTRFTKHLLEEEGQELPLDAIFDRWHTEAFRDDDLARIQASVTDYENGERGRPLGEFLTEFDAKQTDKYNKWNIFLDSSACRNRK